MPKKRYTFVLNFGYAENASLSFMPWMSNQVYTDAKTALIDLATFFKEEYIDKGAASKFKSCCLLSRAKDDKAKFCAKCGVKLAEIDFDDAHFRGWLYVLHEQDNDGMNAYIEWDQTNRWQFGQLENTPNQRFVYQAERVLPAALGFSHDEGYSFAEICKRRTKNKEDSFSYWG